MLILHQSIMSILLEAEGVENGWGPRKYCNALLWPAKETLVTSRT
jgi:hypothetical protein